VLADAAAAEPPDDAMHEIYARIGPSNFGGEATLGYGVELPSGLAFRLGAVAAYGTWYVDGYASDEATTLGGHVRAEGPVVENLSRRFVLHGALGLRTTAAGDLPTDERSLVPVVEVGARGVVAVSEGLDLYMGMALPVAVAVAPAVELEELGQLFDLGADVWVHDRVALTLGVRTGGLFGYDGDGPKLRAQAEAGIRLALDGAHHARRAPARRDGVGAFVQTEWRVFGFADHLGHGPGVSAGVSLLRDHLKVGLLGYARPGPINPRTFAVRPVNGLSYKGQSTVALRSDGGFVGLLVAPSFDVPGARLINIELPVAVGQAAYGFYLHGDDRQTPDGRRVREWENELFDGRDSSVTLGLEAGVELGVRIPGAEWLKPFAAFHYAWALGFDTLVRDSYDGPSGALGLEVEM
jgi:hypothetical protein